MKFDCPHCAQILEVADEWSGHAVDCPICQQAFTVPAVAVAMAIPMREETPRPAAKSHPPQFLRPAPGNYTPPKPPRGGGGGFGWFVLMLIVLACAGFGYAMVHFNESPQQVWQRLVDFVQTLGKPAPAPTPTPEPTPTSTPTLAPTPEATPEPTATPAPTPVDPLAWLLEHKERAPKEVVLERPAALSASANGKVIGSVTVPAGSKVQVVGFTAATVDVRVGNAVGQVPLDATNLRALAKAEQEKAAPNPEAFAITPQQSPSVGPPTTFPALRFQHPGIPLTRKELDTIKANLDKQPWKRGYAQLANTATAKLDWKVEGPFENVSRKGRYDQNLVPWQNSMNAVYNLARMWYFTGDNAYAQKAHDILLAWATTHVSFTGNESGLALGDHALAFGGGASILRGTWPGWTTADTVAVQNYFSNVLWPASAGWPTQGPANKGAIYLEAGIAIAVFCDNDPSKFEHVLNMFRTFHGTCLMDTLPTGQLGETGRDGGHAFGMLNAMTFIAECAWKQGVDLYSELDNRMLACGEYYARNTFTTDNPYVYFGTIDWQWISNKPGPYTANRGAFYLLQNAYKNRKGLPTPWIDRKLLEQPVDANNFMYAKTADFTTATLTPASFPAVSPASSGLTLTTLGSQTAGRSVSYANGVWTMTGLGNGVSSDTTDGCQFAYTKMTGDCAMVAKITSNQYPNAQARAGLMIRDNLTSTVGQRAWIGAVSAPTMKMESHMRGWTSNWGGGGYDDRSHDWPPGLPYWIKIERRGKQITTFAAPDGTSWSPLNCTYYGNLPSSLYIGLFVCSGTTTTNTATFENVAFTGGTGGLVTTPAAPLGLLACGSNKAITLRWLASYGATAYDVLRSTTSGSGYTVIASNLTAAKTSYVDTTAAAGTTYYYVVQAKNSVGTSGNSPEFYGSLLPAPMVNLVFSGTSTASFNQDSEMEGSAKAFDSDPGTKWFGHNSPTGWLQYDFGAGNAQVVKRYTINSADVADRDPKSWNFLGSQDGSNWTTLDSQSNQSFVTRMGMNAYDIGNTIAYRYYRLNITANNGATGVAISELGLWSDSGHTIPSSKSLKHAKP